MKLGITSGTDRASFEKARDLGLDFIEICCNFDEDNARIISTIDDIKKNIAETGVNVASLGRWNLIANKEGRVDEEQLNKQIQLMEAAAEIGSPVFVCGCNYDESVSLYKNYGAAIEYFSRITGEADRLGLKAAVYNCSWQNFVNCSLHWDVVLEEVPKLMIKYDCSHSYARGDDYLAELNKWLSRVAHIHIKGGLKVNGEGVDDPPAGMDQIDWNSVFALIYKYGYDGGLSIEPHSNTWKGELGDAGVKFTINFLRPYILR